MAYLLTFLAAARLACTGHGQGAALLWCAAVAIVHAVEETRGKLWAFFGRTSGVTALARLETPAGFALLVLPALVLQLVAALWAFLGLEVNPFWLGVLIGARLGDALFSHLLPSSGEDAAETSPGLASAWVYLADALVMAIVWHVPMMSAAPATLLGFAIGAGFFCAVLPALKAVAWLARTFGFSVSSFAFSALFLVLGASLSGCAKDGRYVGPPISVSAYGATLRIESQFIAPAEGNQLHAAAEALWKLPPEERTPEGVRRAIGLAATGRPVAADPRGRTIEQLCAACEQAVASVPPEQRAAVVRQLAEVVSDKAFTIATGQP